MAYPNGVEAETHKRTKIRVMAYDGEAGPLKIAQLARAVVETKLRVPIAGVYPLPQSAKAHARLEQGHIPGRIALKIHNGRS